MPDSPRTSAYDTDMTQFERSDISSRPGSKEENRPKPSPAANATESDPEKAERHAQGPGFDDDGIPPPPPAFGSDAPDGGWRAWLVVFGAWCSSFCTWGWINGMLHTQLFIYKRKANGTFTACGVFQEYYQSTLLKEYSSSSVSWITSLQFFFMMGLVSNIRCPRAFAFR